MGEIADMMLDGTMCSSCGEFLGGDEGYPVMCKSCESENNDEPLAKPLKKKVKCPECGKKVKAVGLSMHIHDVHS